MNTEKNKNILEAMDEDISWCEQCATKGIKSRRRYFRISFKEAVMMCENASCSDLACTPNISSLIVSRSSCTAIEKKEIKNPELIIDSVQLDASPIIQSQSPASNSSEFSALSSLNIDFAEITGLSLSDSKASSGYISDSSAVLSNVCAVKKQLEVNVENLEMTTKSEIILPTQSNPVIECSSDVPETPEIAQKQVTSKKEAIVPTVRLETGCLSTSNNSEINCNDNGNKELLSSVVAVQPNNKTEESSYALEKTDDKSPRYPQWKNADALCWLDVTLLFLVHSETIGTLLDTFPEDFFIKKLCLTYKKAFDLLNPFMDTVRMDSSAVPSETTVSSRAQTDLEIDKLLNRIREEAFSIIQAKMKCSKGKDDSPVFAFFQFLSAKAVEPSFLVRYKMELKCNKCPHHETRSAQKVLLSFSRICKSFSVTNAALMTTCPRCGNPNQRRKIIFDSLPPCVLIHFVDGLPSSGITQYDFDFMGFQYKVKYVVQYLKNPNHFVAWIRDTNDDKWMLCDDLDFHHTQFNAKHPDIVKSDCHIVAWECQELVSSRFLEASASTAIAFKTEYKISSRKEVTHQDIRLRKMLIEHDYCCKTLSKSVLTNGAINNSLFKERSVKSCNNARVTGSDFAEMYKNNLKERSSSTLTAKQRKPNDRQSIVSSKDQASQSIVASSEDSGFVNETSCNAPGYFVEECVEFSDSSIEVFEVGSEIMVIQEGIGSEASSRTTNVPNYTQQSVTTLEVKPPVASQPYKSIEVPINVNNCFLVLLANTDDNGEASLVDLRVKDAQALLSKCNPVIKTLLLPSPMNSSQNNCGNREFSLPADIPESVASALQKVVYGKTYSAEKAAAAPTCNKSVQTSTSASAVSGSSGLVRMGESVEKMPIKKRKVMGHSASTPGRYNCPTVKTDRGKKQIPQENPVPAKDSSNNKLNKCLSLMQMTSKLSAMRPTKQSFVKGSVTSSAASTPKHTPPSSLNFL